MTSRQYFSKGHEPELLHRASRSGGHVNDERDDERTPFVSGGVYRYPSEQVGALLVLGLARIFEWQAAAGHVVISEWTRQQQEWLATMVEMESGLRHFGLSRSHFERMFDVARMLGSWGVTAQLSAAQGLVSSCSPEALGLPANSGRRAGFDLGRRNGAVVIDFPDRRQAGDKR